MEKLFIGIDISKDTFDVCVLDNDHNVIDKHFCFGNDKKGIETFFNYLEGFSEVPSWVCMEHTGYYGALLSFYLSEQGIDYSFINALEIKKSSGITRGKSDPIDAYRIASYGVKHHYKLEPFVLPVVEIQKLKILMSQRDLYSKILVQCKNNYKGLLVLNKSTSVKAELEQAKKAISFNEKIITKLERKMLVVIKHNEDLSKTFNKITKVVGVGPITATKCIIETGNFTKFTKARKFSCHCGFAPFIYQSGSSLKGRTRTSKMSDKSLKGILFKAAVTAINHDPQLKTYYKRKLDEGKHKMSVLNAVANKIVLRIFAVANRDEPFVKFNA